MTMDKNNQPKIDSATAKQWAGQAAVAVSVLTEEQMREERRNRNEILIFLALFILPFFTSYLVATSNGQSPLGRLLGLLLPALTLLFYYKDIIDRDSRSGAQETALLLLLTSSAAGLSALEIANVAYLNPYQFILPSILAAICFVALNFRMKRRRGKWLMWLIMALWLPVYSCALPVLINVMGPPLLSKDVPSSSYSFHGQVSNNSCTYSATVGVEHEYLIVQLKTPLNVYEKFRNHPPLKVTWNKGLLGIDYVIIELDSD